MRLIIAVGLIMGGAAQAGGDEDYVARLQAQAVLETLNAELLSHDSATETLQHWCDARVGAPGQKIAARRGGGPDKPADAAIRRDLQIGPVEPVRYRHVQLTCGDRVLSEADNWYLPARLTPEMNRLLAETDQPFGLVVKPLGFHRRTLSATLLFHPLPEGWEKLAGPPPPSAGGPMNPPSRVLEHRAVLTASDGAPFSLVIETYTNEVLTLAR